MKPKQRHWLCLLDHSANYSLISRFQSFLHAPEMKGIWYCWNPRVLSSYEWNWKVESCSPEVISNCVHMRFLLKSTVNEIKACLLVFDLTSPFAPWFESYLDGWNVNEYPKLEMNPSIRYSFLCMRHQIWCLHSLVFFQCLVLVQRNNCSIIARHSMTNKTCSYWFCVLGYAVTIYIHGVFPFPALIKAQVKHASL